MKIKFPNLETGDILFERELLPSQEIFWESEERYILFSGGVGCIAGETIIEGKTIEERWREGQCFWVTDGNGNRSLAMPPVRYNPTELYRVTTNRDSFVATAEHRVRTSHNGFVSVKELSLGQQLESSVSLPHSNLESFPSILSLSVLHLTQRLRDFLNGCRSLCHSCGVQLLSWLKIFPEISPSPSDVLSHNLHGSFVGGWEKELKYNQIYRHSDHLSKRGFVRRFVQTGEGEEGHTSSRAFAHALLSTQLPELSLSMIFRGAELIIRDTFSLVLNRVFGLSQSNPIEYNKVLSIAKERVDNYYDFHVVGSHTYQAHLTTHSNCGKSMIMLLRVLYECMFQDNNYFLVGRTTYQEIHDVLIKEFMEICPESWMKEYRKTPHPTVVLHTFNGKTSEIIFRNLDGMSQGELLGLNLGGFAIDQAEDVPEEVFLTLKGRLRRANIKHRVFMTSNPKLSWLYRAFKQEPEPNYKLIEASTLENKKNLPEDYINDLLNYPPSWKRQYVDGIWDASLLSDNIVFAREHIEELGAHVHAPLEVKEGVNIYRKHVPGHRYQIGIDSSEGVDTTEDSIRKSQKDSGVIVVWDKTAEEEVAMFSARIPPRVLAEKAVLIASWYENPEMVPEMNSMGLALTDKLDELGYSRVYRRKEFDRVTKKTMKKVGWRMTAASKQLAISYFSDLMRLRKPRIYSRETVEEMKTFVYTDNAKKKGAGAQQGFHDDKIVATLLACFDEAGVRPGKIYHEGRDIIISDMALVPSVEIINGKYRPPRMANEDLNERRNVATWKSL